MTAQQLLTWSKNWKVHLPCEAGYHLAISPENKKGIAAFFYMPYLNTARYRGFFEAANRIPALKKMEQQKIITEDGMYANAAKRQRLGIIMGQTALALKIYRIEHEKYPEKLSELVPRYLLQEYFSPSNGKTLDYSVKEYSECRTLHISGTTLHEMSVVSEFALSSDGSSITSER